MKTLYVVSDNDRLKFIFEEFEEVELAIHLKKHEPEIECDAVILDGGLVHHQQLAEIREWYPNHPIFYKLGHVPSKAIMSNIRTVCEAYHIHLLSEYLDDSQIANDVIDSIFEREREAYPQIISFFGTHSGAGVSTTVFSVAKMLSQRVQEKVVVLSLNPWDPSDYFLNYNGRYLNEIKLDLKMNALNEKKLIESVCYYEEEGFYHLAGNWDVKLQRYFKGEEIYQLIELARRCFDVVLIDAGTHYDNACSTQSYKSSELKFLVTTQEDKGYRCYWRHAFQQMIEPLEGDSSNYMLIINRYMPGVSLINEKDMQKELDMSLLTTIPDQDIRAHLAINQKKLLADEGDNQYRKSIAVIINSIIARANLTKVEIEDDQKKGFLSKLFSRNKAAM
ncbi:AAA family ATPase [Desertibacillus haloalkaliphilus]|uniref:AAA family ATPase n=1 Tax=Desertibacillus haloalkaliphilus TaxID=1328930 RepID=UPI001C2619E1|nr:ParA family protein [Desertibacillus haloalkaliphilus]MBU8908059.1 ParA family protein [Desertibacillus haloalkaliphilus]